VGVGEGGERGEETEGGREGGREGGEGGREGEKELMKFLLATHDLVLPGAMTFSAITLSCLVACRSWSGA
jgi:hypothetical protein